MKRIVIDHRENADILLNLLSEKYGFNIEVSALKFGDYYIKPDITVERKTTKDFLISVIDGRLFKQVFNLVNYTGRPILLVEGKSFKDSGINFKTESLKGVMIALAQTFYIPVLRTLDEKDTAWYLNQMYEQRQRIGKNKGCLQGYKGKKIDTQKAHLLMALPGIGNKTAKDLLKHFESVSDIINASEKELMGVRGIGKVTAKRIRNVVSEETSDYLIN